MQVNPLNTEVSFYENTLNGTPPANLNLHDCLLNKNNAINEQLRKAREWVKYNQLEKIKPFLPSFTPTGVFNPSAKDKIWKNSYLIGLEAKVNYDYYTEKGRKQLLMYAPYLVYMGKSICQTKHILLIHLEYYRNHEVALEVAGEHLKCHRIHFINPEQKMSEFILLPDEKFPFINLNATFVEKNYLDERWEYPE